MLVGCIFLCLTYSFPKAIPCDAHVISWAIGYEWVWKGASAHDVRAVLEAIIPKLCWDDFNETYGALGQLFSSKNLEGPICCVIERSFPDCSARLSSMLEIYRNKGRQGNKGRRQASK